MVRLLCTGDLHLGRHPTRVPRSTREVSVAHVWDAVVDYAADQSVDALVLTGDVVDRENRFYESVGPLQRGLQRLAKAGVDVFAVSGNHDWDVLPNLVQTLDLEHFHLLGAGGTWSSALVRGDAGVAARLVGWSYRQQLQERSPLEQSPIDGELPGAPDVPVLGLLHAEIDQPRSRYAPVASGELAEAPVDGWLLGHIHAPQRVDIPGSFGLYPGSPQPLDPTETGAHGPWLVEVDETGVVDASMVPLATLRYGRREVDVSGITDEAGFREAVTSALHDALEEIARGDTQLRAAVFRMRCVGRTPRSRDLDRYTEQAIDELRVERASLTATIDAIDMDTRPAIELERLLEGRDPPGELARLLVALRDGDEVDAELLDRAADRIADVHKTNAYAPLRRDPETRERPDREGLRDLLYRQGLRLLETLLAQGESAEPGETDG